MNKALQIWEKFWFDRQVEEGRLRALRIVLFGLLGIDMIVLMVEKAYRYGTGDFNVAHMDWMHGILPIPSAMVHTVMYLFGGFLALRVAMGIAMKRSVVMLTFIYAYTYFSSLHDGYQHHYLIAWILFIFWFIPIEKTIGIDGVEPTPKAAHHLIPAWGLGLLYAQVSVVYFFTAIAKHNPNWWSGWALKQQIGTTWVRDMLVAQSELLHLPGNGMFAVVATSVFAWQAIASLSFVFKRLRAFACISGPLFHVMVEVIGLEIRWFSYYMIALYYLLLFPEHWYQPVARFFSRISLPFRQPFHAVTEARTLSPIVRWSITGVGAILAYFLGASVPLPGATYLGLALALAVLGSELLAEGGPRSIGSKKAVRTLGRIGFQVAAIALLAVLPRTTGTAYDYHRQKGGDLSRRGEVTEAIDAYYDAVELNPGPNSRHYKLGTLLIREKRFDEAVRVLEAGLSKQPNSSKLQKALAQANQGI